MALAAAAVLAGCAKKTDDAQPLTAATHTADASISSQYGVLRYSPYFLQNNIWNAGTAGAGAQTCFINSLNDWGVDAAHSTGSGQIKSYPSIVYGQHYGTDSGAGRLPKKIQDLGLATTSWNQTSSGTRFDAAYDVWFDPSTDVSGRAAKDELMIWVDWAGTNPLASGYDANGAIAYAKSVLLGGRHWNIYHKDIGNGSDVISFLPAGGGQNSITVDMKPLISYCVNRGWLQSAEYMTSIQAGWEITAGGTFRTSRFTIDGTTL